MAKNSAYLARIQMANAVREEQARRHARIFQMDLVTLALGRMGKRESFSREFDKVLGEVSIEYSKEIIEDGKNDPDLWYTKDTLDRELKQYTGSFFVPYDERYADVLGVIKRDTNST